MTWLWIVLALVGLVLLLAAAVLLIGPVLLSGYFGDDEDDYPGYYLGD